jgi:hypothetical protein
MDTHLPLHFSPIQIALLTIGLACLSAPLTAQDSGSVSFDSTESALTGTVACNGGVVTPISSVDASATDVTGSNDAVASNLIATACGLPFYTITSANDASSASDTSTQDDGAGTSSVSQMSLLGGVLTYDTKTETDNCNANTPGEVNCTDTTTVTNFYFAGQHITGTFTQPTTFNAVSVTVQIPGYCTGVALFTGQLTVAGSNTQTSGNTTEIQMTPVALEGTLSCVGLPLTQLQIVVADVEDISFSNEPHRVVHEVIKPVIQFD